jgi:hypothetical protein
MPDLYLMSEFSKCHVVFGFRTSKEGKGEEHVFEGGNEEKRSEET